MLLRGGQTLTRVLFSVLDTHIILSALARVFHSLMCASVASFSWARGCKLELPDLRLHAPGAKRRS